MDGAMLRKVHLTGRLADGVGDVLELAFDTPARALRLIEVNFPGFLQRFREGYYFVTVVKPNYRRNLRENELHAGFTGDLVLTPAIGGASSGKRKGLLGALLGAVLIGAAFFFSGGTLSTALPGFLGAGGATFGSISQLGIGLVLNGIATMLTPTPNTDYSDVDEKRSFMFNGPTNLSEQGGVLPVIFGTMMVGTTTVSASVASEFVTGSVGGSQSAVTTRHTIDRATETIDLYYGDIARREAGVTLTHINGQAVSGAGTLSLPSMDLSVQYDVAGNGTGIPNFPLGATNGFKRPVMRFSYTVVGSPQNVNVIREVTYRFTHESVSYDGKVLIEIGRQAFNDVFFSRGSDD